MAIGRDANGVEGLKTAYIAEIPAVGAKPEKPLVLDSQPDANVLAVAWTSDGQRLVTVDQNNGPSSAVKIWSVEGKLLQQYKLGTRDGSSLHFLNDKQILLTWYNDGSAKKFGKRGHGQSVLTLGDSITESHGAALARRRLRPGRPGRPFSRWQGAVLTGGTHQNEILIWDVATGDLLHHLGRQLTTARFVGWSKDGKHLGLDAFEQKEKSLFRYALNLVEMQLAQQVEARGLSLQAPHQRRLHRPGQKRSGPALARRTTHRGTGAQHCRHDRARQGAAGGPTRSTITAAACI